MSNSLLYGHLKFSLQVLAAFAVFMAAVGPALRAAEPPVPSKDRVPHYL